MTAFLFPGQGSQQPGTVELFRSSCDEASALFLRAEQILPPEVLKVILEGDHEELSDTRYAQPALLCTEVMASALLGSLGVVPEAVAGHSLGEISALVVSAALEFETALGVVLERARLMSANVPEGGMAAVIGLSASEILDAISETVQVANFNGPAQTIISGSREGLIEAGERLRAAGAKRVLPLAVSGPFHSRYMKPAAAALACFLEDIPLAAPEIPFLSSVSGQFEKDPGRIRFLLAEQLYQPVQWTLVMEHLSGGAALEVGPGNVLQGLAKRMPGGPTVRTASTPAQCREFAASPE